MGHAIDSGGDARLCENPRCCQPHRRDTPFCGGCWAGLPPDAAERILRLTYLLAAEVRVAVDRQDREDAKTDPPRSEVPA